MLIKKATQEDIREWKEIYEKHKNTLTPNKKSAEEIIGFLKSRYTATEIIDAEYKRVVSDNILLNGFSRDKLKGKTPEIRLFKISDEGLFYRQDAVFKGTDIIVGIEVNTSYIFVEGSSELYDELFAFAGLDECDLKNYFLVAEYVKLTNKSNTL